MKTIAPARAPRRFSVPILFAVAMLAPPAAHAQVNKCVDPSGKVVAYGSECPSGTKPQATGIRSAPTAPAAAPGKSVAEQEADFRKRRMEQQEAQAKSDKLAAENEGRARACESARSYLKSLQSGTRIVRTDPNTGERVVLDDSGYARETATAQRAVDVNCK